MKFLIKVKDGPEQIHKGGINTNPNTYLSRLQESESRSTEGQADLQRTDLSQDLDGDPTV